MKHRIAGCLAAVLGTAAVAADFTARINQGEYIITGATGGYKRNQDDTATAVVRSGPGKLAKLTNSKDGLELTAKKQISALLVRSGAAQKLSSADGSGGVVVQLTNAERSSRLESDSATYKKGTDEDRVDAIGKVTINDLDKAASSTLVATGQRGFATFDAEPQANRKSRLRRGELRGAVTLTVDQAKSATRKPGSYKVKGDLATFDYVSVPAQIILRGNVQIDGKSDPDLAEITGVTELVMRLNADGEVVSIEANGEPTRSEFTRKGGSGLR